MHFLRAAIFSIAALAFTASASAVDSAGLCTSEKCYSASYLESELVSYHVNPDTKLKSNRQKIFYLCMDVGQFFSKAYNEHHKCSTEPIQGDLDWGRRIFGTGIKEFGSKGRAEVLVHRGQP